MAGGRVVAVPALHGAGGAVRSADPAARARGLRGGAGISHAAAAGLPRGGRALADRRPLTRPPRARRRLRAAGAGVRRALRRPQPAAGQPHGDGRRPADDGRGGGRALHGAAPGGLAPSHRQLARRARAGVHRLRVRRALAAGVPQARGRDVPGRGRSPDADHGRHLRHPDPGVGHLHLPVRDLRRRHVPRGPPASLHRRLAGARRRHARRCRARSPSSPAGSSGWSTAARSPTR